MKNNENMSFTEYAELTKAVKGENTKHYNVTSATAARDFRESQDENDLPRGLLPTFPVGYILCKDVVIKVATSSSLTTEDKTHLSEKAQSSGGCLCFSYNQASEHTKDTSRAAFDFASDGMIVRIPGPQILGYVQQVMPVDSTTPYETKLSLGQDFYLPETTTPAMATNPPKRAHGAAPPRQNNGDGGDDDNELAKPILFTIPDAKSSTIDKSGDQLDSKQAKTVKPVTKDPLSNKPSSNGVASDNNLTNGVDPEKPLNGDERTKQIDHTLSLLIEKLKSKDSKALQELLDKM